MPSADPAKTGSPQPCRRLGSHERYDPAPALRDRRPGNHVVARCPIRARATGRSRSFAERATDVVCDAAGNRIEPFAILGCLKETLGPAQYRLICVERELLVLQYRPGRSAPVQLDATVKRLSEIVGAPIKIIAQKVPAIERENSGKLRPIINLSTISGKGRDRLLRDLHLADLPKRRRFLFFSTRHRRDEGKLRAGRGARYQEIQGSPATVDSRAPRRARPQPARAPGRSSVSSERKPGGRRFSRQSSPRFCPVTIRSILPPIRPSFIRTCFVDSRNFLMIIRDLERELGFEIDDEALLGVDLITYGDLVRFVGSILPGEGKKPRDRKVASSVVTSSGVTTWCNFLYDFPEYYAESTSSPTTSAARWVSMSCLSNRSR